MTPKDESPRSEDVQYATGEAQGRITTSPRKNEAMDQSGHDAQLWICLLMNVKSNDVRKMLHRNMECQVQKSKKIGCGPAGDGKNKH